MDETPITVEAIANSRLIVWNPSEARRLYNNGFYGKPLGIPKPREDFEAPLVLDPIESLYLLEKGLIQVISGPDKTETTLDELRETTLAILERLDMKYAVYRNLRERGYVVTPGIKYGCDFAVYEHGPGVDHAPFIVQVKSSGDGLTAPEIVEAGRLATTVRKTFLIALVDGEDIRFLSFKWWKP